MVSYSYTLRCMHVYCLWTKIHEELLIIGYAFIQTCLQVM